MGQQGSVDAQRNEQDEVERSHTYVLNRDGEFVPLRADEDGELSVETDIDAALESEALDELRVLVYGPDAGGTLQDANVEAFDTALAAGDFGIATYSGRALDSIGEDDLRSLVRGLDSDGGNVTVVAQALNSALASADDVGLLTYLSRALESQGQDELVTRAAGADGVQIAEEALNSGVAAGDVGIVTYLARALDTVGQDDLRALLRATDSDGSNVDVVAQALDAALAAASDVGLLTYGDRALQTQAQDEHRMRVFGPDAGGTLQQVLAEQFDTALGATDVGLATYGDRALASIGADELVSRLADSAGSQIDPRKQGGYAVAYTTIDENTAATTAIYSPANDAEVSHVHLNNPGTTAELRLEVTDGTDVSVLQDPGAGESIDFNGAYFLDGGVDSLQIVVEVVEGAAQSETASVGRSEL